MAIPHDQYDNNDLREKGRPSNGRRKLIIIVCVLIALAFIDAIFKFLLILLYIILIAMVSLAIALVISMAYYHHKDGKRKRMPPLSKDIMERIPDDMMELVKRHDPDAEAICHEYDMMMSSIKASGGDTDIIAARYGEKMTLMADVIRKHQEVERNPSGYSDAKDLDKGFHDAVNSLINQFHDTLQSENRTNAMDMRANITAISSERMESKIESA